MEAFATKALERYWTINAGVLEVPILLARCLSVALPSRESEKPASFPAPPVLAGAESAA